MRRPVHEDFLPEFEDGFVGWMIGLPQLGEEIQCIDSSCRAVSGCGIQDQKGVMQSCINHAFLGILYLRKSEHLLLSGPAGCIQLL